MVQYIPPPEPRDLLPPLLACFPTAFASPRAPPALLLLLSPILRQRVQLLATTATSSSESWLPLLCWEYVPAQKLVDTVTESDAFELHPVSGEIDFGEVDPIKYRRLDEETLQSRLVLPEMGLVIILLWCEGDQEGGGNGWRVSEVRPLGDRAEHAPGDWWPTITQADEKAHDRMADDALGEGENASITVNGETVKDADDGDDDDYWARYDNTPGRTPGPNPSPGPPAGMQAQNGTTLEAEHYAQYAQVQPEMDNDDPSEDKQAIGESTLNGNLVTSSSQMPRSLAQDNRPPDPTENDNTNISQPTASPGSCSARVSRLEGTAESQSVAQVAAQQHVSTSIKSLFRLCRATGMERSDFDEIVRTELEALSLMEEDD